MDKIIYNQFQRKEITEEYKENTRRIQGEYKTTTITLRLDENVLLKIDSLRGDENRSEYIRKLIVSSIEYKENTGEYKENTGEYKENTGEYKENTEIIEVLKQDIEHLRSQNVDLTKLLNQEQSLHLQTQRQLIPTREERKEKKWFEFWKSG